MTGRASLHAAPGKAGLLTVSLITALLAACGSSGEDSRIGIRTWGTFDVAVEVRPSPPRAGRNEVVVLVSGEHHRPVFDALVSVRTDAAQPWVQAIEDGHVGVYRRGVIFERAAVGVLQERLQRAQTDDVLEFPVPLAPGP